MPDSVLQQLLSAFGGPWIDRAKAQTADDIAAYQQGGLKALMANTQGTQDLAGGFGGNIKSVGQGIRAYHGSTERNLKSISNRNAVETSGATFHATNPDVAESFTFPREYGEPVYYNEAGREIKRGRVYETQLTPKNLYEVPGNDAQKFIDDTTFQGEIIRKAIGSGHDAVVARDILEGIGERYKGDVYAALNNDIIKIIRKYGLAGTLPALMASGNEQQSP